MPQLPTPWARRLASAPPAPLRLLAHAVAVAVAVPSPSGAVAAEGEGAAGALPAVTVKAPRAGDIASEHTGAYTTPVTRSATRLELAPRETPQAVGTVTRTQMNDFGLTDARAALSHASGLHVERVETDRVYYTARGFEVQNFQIDGLGLPFATGDQIGDLDMALYDRVEVLRGANGLSSFTGNPSATVNFVRKRPTAQPQASASVAIGSWDSKRLDVDLSGPLDMAGSVRGRLILGAQDNDSYLDRYRQTKGVAGALVEVDLARDTVLVAGVSHQSNRPRGVMWGALPLQSNDGTRPLSHDRSSSTAQDWTYWDTKDTNAFAEMTQRLAGGWQVKGTATHRRLSSDSKLFYVYTLPSDPEGTWRAYPSQYWSDQRQTLLDVHASGPFELGGRRHEAVIGLTASKRDLDQSSLYSGVGDAVSVGTVLDGAYPLPDFRGPVDPADQGDFTDRRDSVYGLVRLHLAEALKAFVGINHTRAKSTGSSYGTPHDYEASKTAPYVGAVYDLDEAHSLYASYAKIFNPQYQRDRDDRILPAVEGSNAELGIKSEWLGGALTGSLALFRVEQNNTAVTDGSSPTPGRYKAVDSRSRGFEIDLAGRLTPGLTVHAGYTQLRFDGEGREGERTFIPRRSLHLAAVYRVPAVPALKLGAHVNWRSQTHREEGSSTIRQPGYALLDLVAGYELDPNLSLLFKVNNATNEKHLTSLHWAQSYYGPPRHYSLALNWKL